MPTSRALCGAIFLAAAVVLSVALPTDIDAVVPEESLVEAIMSSDMEDSAEVEKKAKKTLGALTALKAYAVSAADKVIDYKEAHSKSTDTAVINFIALYAQESVKDKNLVTAYAKAMGKAKAIFTGGIGLYLLEHLSRSMKKGIDVTTQAKIDGKRMRRLSGKKLGLVSQPKYLDDLAVFDSNYQSKFYEIQKHADSADAEAATEWLLAGEKKQYKSFKQREDEEDKAKEKKHMEKKTAEALKAIKESFDKTKKLPGLSESGVAGADGVADLKGVRTEQEKREAAKLAAEKWRKANGATDAAEAEQNEVETKTEEAEKKKLFEEKQSKACKKVDCGLGKATVGCSILTLKGDGYVCTCPTGYVGGGLKKACQDRNECDGVDCGEGGTCEQKVGQTDNSYKCKCQEGFTGGGKNKGCSKPAGAGPAAGPAPVKGPAADMVNVWGVNKNNDIFYNTEGSVAGNGKWTHVGGKLKRVSVTGGTIWGVSPIDEIFYRAGRKGTWTKVNGKLKDISASQGDVWGVNSGDNIYYRAGGASGSWKHIPGKLKQISTSNGNVWGVNKNNDIYYRAGAGGSWKHISGKLKQVSVSGDNVWGVNNNDLIFHRVGVGGKWKHISGLLKWVGVSGNHVYGVNSHEKIFYRAGVDGKWAVMNGLLKQISLDHVAAAPAPAPVIAPSVLQCQVATAKSDKAGVVKPTALAGATLTGGGINNHYRSWDAKAGFEESYPEGNQYRCDMGFGPGKVTCYGIYCSVSNAKTPLDCVTKSTSFDGSGARAAKLPAGYTMTGGGLKNTYRSFNKKAGFEDSHPVNQDSWLGDMGFGPGKYTAYVRGCKGLTCKTVTGKRGNTGTATCPSGYQVTGCGIKNYYRKWDKKSGFEQTNPKGNGCFCDGGFGTGDVVCYARCCKLHDSYVADTKAPTKAPTKQPTKKPTVSKNGQIKVKQGKCLDASQRNKAGGKVHIWDCNINNLNQQWNYQPNLAGQIRVKQGKCLDASQRNKKGGKVHIWDCNTGNKNQQWAYTHSTGQIKAKHGKCLDASQRNKVGGLVHMWDCNTGNLNQQWVYSP